MGPQDISSSQYSPAPHKRHAENLNIITQNKRGILPFEVSTSRQQGTVPTNVYSVELLVTRLDNPLTQKETQASSRSVHTKSLVTKLEIRVSGITV